MELYATLDRYIKEIPADELRSRFTGCQQSYLMRTIIMNERNFMPSYTWERSLRRLWYSVVKPTLDKLGLPPKIIM